MKTLKQILIEIDNIQAYIFPTPSDCRFLRLLFEDGNEVDLVGAFDDDHHERKFSLEGEIRVRKFLLSDHDFFNLIESAERLKLSTKSRKTRLFLQVVCEFLEVLEDFLRILPLSI